MLASERASATLGFSPLIRLLESLSLVRDRGGGCASHRAAVPQAVKFRVPSVVENLESHDICNCPFPGLEQVLQLYRVTERFGKVMKFDRALCEQAEFVVLPQTASRVSAAP